MADIDPIREGSWGAKAAAGDVLNRVPNDAPFMGVWIEKNAQGEEIVKWSKANMSFQQYSYMAIVLAEFAQQLVRQSMERRG